ncbi:hypothetical protein HN51_008940, partial [Arachis hypogaea]
SIGTLVKNGSTGCLPNAVTFETVIRALFEKDENDMAEKLLRKMSELYICCAEEDTVEMAHDT